MRVAAAAALLLTISSTAQSENPVENVLNINTNHRNGRGFLTDMAGLLGDLGTIVDDFQDHAREEVERIKPALSEADDDLEEAVDHFKSAFDRIADSFGSGPAFTLKSSIGSVGTGAQERVDDGHFDGGVRVPDVRMPGLFSQAFGGNSEIDPLNPLSIFGLNMKSYKPWYEGENVCVESKIFEENIGGEEETSGETEAETGSSADIVEDPNAQVELIGDKRLSSPSVRSGKNLFDLMMSINNEFNSHVHTCSNGPNYHQCKTIESNGRTKTTEVTRYECCYGFTKTNDGCTQLNMRNLKDTVGDMQAEEFEELLEEAGMMDLLEKQNLTVFVPSNDAIEDFRHDLEEVSTSVEFVQGNGVTDLRDTDYESADVSYDTPRYNIDDGFAKKRRKRQVSQAKVKQIIQSHLIPGFVSTSDVQDEDLIKTVGDNGHKLRITVYNTYPEKVVMANCARVTSRDHYATNGIVHIVDKVVLPAAGTIADVVANDPELRTLNKILSKSGVMEELEEAEGHFTLFAPTDAAFEKIDKSLIEKLIRGDGCGIDIVNNHILPNVVCSGVMTKREAKAKNLLASHWDQYVTLKKDDDDVFYANGARVVVRDIMATNGVIHIIEKVLVPTTAVTLSKAVSDRPEMTHVLENAGLGDGLNDLTNVTFLIPTERSLSKMHGAGHELSRDQVMFHVITPETPIGMMRDNMRLKTAAAAGKKIRINSYPPEDMGPFGLALLTGEAHNSYTAQCVKIAWKEKDICGGVLLEVAHPLPMSAPSVMDLLKEGHPRFYELIKKVDGLEEQILSQGEDVTIFAPTDDAFEKMTVGQANDLSSDPEVARKTVLGHILDKFMCCAGIHRRGPFLDDSNKRMMTGEPRVIRRSRGDRFYVDNAQVTRCDMVADNGVVHAVDEVFVPVANRVVQSRRTNIHRILDLLEGRNFY